jgi:UDP-glucose 4-epimerase
MNVLVTGGAGYIGSHAALRLIEDAHAVTVIDNCARGNRGAIAALQQVAAQRQADFQFIECDIGDRARVEALLRTRGVELVMHFAALAYVGESVQQPLRYYRANAAGALALIEAMDAAGVKRMVFSSTCATYGEPPPSRIPIAEDCPQNPINPYGRSKLHVENFLFDHAHAQRLKGEDFAFVALRYFNVAGADRRGRIGEDHKPETHLVPICLEVAIGQREAITIHGDDYPTPDGTCIRDYVHVEDLIDAHVVAMDALKPGEARAYNVGLGRGHSVREVIDACRRATNVNFPETVGPRRDGDPPVLYNDPTRITDDLHWQARMTDLQEIVATAWRWKQSHPTGYR